MIIENKTVVMMLDGKDDSSYIVEYPVMPVIDAPHVVIDESVDIYNTTLQELYAGVEGVDFSLVAVEVQKESGDKPVIDVLKSLKSLPYVALNKEDKAAYDSTVLKSGKNKGKTIKEVRDARLSEEDQLRELALERKAYYQKRFNKPTEKPEKEDSKS